jgi:hypothetical protein
MCTPSTGKSLEKSRLGVRPLLSGEGQAICAGPTQSWGTTPTEPNRPVMADPLRVLFKTAHRNTICDIVIAHVRVPSAIVADVTLLRTVRKGRIVAKFDLDQPISKPCPKKLSADCPVTRSFWCTDNPQSLRPKR